MRENGTPFSANIPTITSNLAAVLKRCKKDVFANLFKKKKLYSYGIKAVRLENKNKQQASNQQVRNNEQQPVKKEDRIERSSIWKSDRGLHGGE